MKKAIKTFFIYASILFYVWNSSYVNAMFTNTKIAIVNKMEAVRTYEPSSNVRNFANTIFFIDNWKVSSTKNTTKKIVDKNKYSKSTDTRFTEENLKAHWASNKKDMMYLCENTWIMDRNDPTEFDNWVNHPCYQTLEEKNKD